MRSSTRGRSSARLASRLARRPAEIRSRRWRHAAALLVVVLAVAAQWTVTPPTDSSNSTGTGTPLHVGLQLRRPESSALASSQTLSATGLDGATNVGGPESVPLLAEPQPVADASPPLIPQAPPVFVEYEVQPGDTVSGIAERFGIANDYILWNNVDVIEDADALAVGAVLQVPGVAGIIHSARIGDTASDLAVEYDSTTEAIVEFEANGFAGNPDNLPIGALILVPGGRRIPPPVEVVPPAPSVETAIWAWPATGRLTSLFGARHPHGIDISMIVGTPLRAAMSGQVVFVGGSACCSYGYHVIIDHGEGYETLYAHLSEIYVSNGQWVSGGEIIGASGNTGYSTGPHLHFEVRQNKMYRDPLAYLP